MSRHIKVRAVLTKRSEDLGDGTWLGSRVIQHEFLVPIGPQTTGWHFASPFPVETTTFEFVGPDIDAEIFQARAELLDELRTMSLDQIVDYLAEDKEEWEE